MTPPVNLDGEWLGFEAILDDLFAAPPPPAAPPDDTFILEDFDNDQ